MYDIAIIGAGIVGLATGCELIQRHPEASIVLVEKESEVGAHQTTHNSGVIHSGTYYVPSSLKARLCVAGANELYSYCAAKGIPTEQCGKLIVAATAPEVPRLEELLRRGLANGVIGLELLGPEAMQETEPYCSGVKALRVPSTGIVNFGAVARAMATDLREAGAEILVEHCIKGLRVRANGVQLLTSQGSIEARRAIACAGLHSDRVAAMSGASSTPRIVPFRGDYWQIRTERKWLVRNLIYPVPDPRLPFLGVHFTRRIGTGEVLLGPNAVLALSREGYRRMQARFGDSLRTLTFRGFLRMAARNWRYGITELHRDFSKTAFLRSCQRYIPALTSDDLVPGPSGVRAQALGSDGTLIDDFLVEYQGGRMLHVRNAPSPAATSSLAIGRLIADAFDQAA